VIAGNFMNQYPVDVRGVANAVVKVRHRELNGRSLPGMPFGENVQQHHRVDAAAHRHHVMPRLKFYRFCNIHHFYFMLKRMKRLYFVRHGLSEMNKMGLFAGSTDTPLTAEGRQQAKLAGQKAKDYGINYIVCSPLSRAHDTARIIAKEIGYPEEDIHLNSLLVERHFGELEGKSWAPDLNVDGFSDIETVDNLLERARRALDFLESLEQDTVLVVSHGAFGRALRHHAIVDFPFSTYIQIPNAEIFQLL
jgi:uncharacterized phosphatase